MSCPTNALSVIEHGTPELARLLSLSIPEGLRGRVDDLTLTERKARRWPAIAQATERTWVLTQDEVELVQCAIALLEFNAPKPVTMLCVASMLDAQRQTHTLICVTVAGVWLLSVTPRGCVGRLGRTPEQIDRMCELHSELAGAITEADRAWRQMRSRNDVTVH